MTTNASDDHSSLAYPAWLLNYVRCPISQSRLVPADPDWLISLAYQLPATPLYNRLGRTISELPTQGLLGGDGRWLYPVRNGIPCLVPDEAIEVPATKC